MFRSMAVTTDFSDAARAAFGAAGSLARKLGARLYLLHVARDPAGFYPWQARAKAQYEAEARVRTADLERKLEAVVCDEPAFAGLPVKTRVLHDGSAAAISKFQRTEEIDLIVMATHGHTGVKHFLLGSFSAKVLQLAACPVLLVRTSDDGRGSSTPAFHPQRILVPHDFSKASVESLVTARDMAAEFEADVRLLHVVESHGASGGGPLEKDPDLAEYYENVRAEAMDRLRQLIAAEWAGVSAEACVRKGHPAIEILKEAYELPADLIVMASRGLSVLDRISVGSVAERIVHRAPCPVLIVKGGRERAALVEPAPS